MIRPVLLLVVWLAAGCADRGGAMPGHDPDYAEAAKINTQLGIDYYRQGNVRLAIEKLEKARLQDPRLAATHAALGLAYSQIGDEKAADKSFRKALRRSDNNPDFLNNYGAFLCEHGATGRAQELFLQAAGDKRYPTPEVAFTNAGSCARSSGDPAQAEQYYRRALKHNPRHGEAMLQLAAMSFEGGDYLRSRAFLQRFEAWNQPTPDSLLLGLRTEHALGDRAAAVAYAERLRTLVPGIGQHINLSTGQAL